MTIKNGDLPAMPVSTSESICQMTGTLKQDFSGLTKREMFAMAAMQGIMANPASLPEHGGHFKNIAEDATRMADALLEQLERKK